MKLQRQLRKQVPTPKPRRKTIDSVARGTVTGFLKSTSQEPAKAEQPNDEKLKSTKSRPIRKGQTMGGITNQSFGEYQPPLSTGSNRLPNGSTSSTINGDRTQPRTSAHQQADSETHIDYTKYDYAKVSSEWESKSTHGKNEEKVKSTVDGLKRSQSLSHGIRERTSHFQQNKVEQLVNIEQQGEAKEEDTVKQKEKVELQGEVSEQMNKVEQQENAKSKNKTVIKFQDNIHSKEELYVDMNLEKRYDDVSTTSFNCII